MRICLQKLGGEFISIDLNNTQVGVCKLGNSYIGSMDLVAWNNSRAPKSIEQYISRQQLCFGGQVNVQVNSTPQILCVYDDGSMLDLNTVLLGRDSKQNVFLNIALDLQ